MFFEEWCKCNFKSHKQENGVLKVTDEKIRILSRIRIRTKMSRIRNTGYAREPQKYIPAKIQHYKYELYTRLNPTNWGPWQETWGQPTEVRLTQIKWVGYRIVGSRLPLTSLLLQEDPKNPLSREPFRPRVFDNFNMDFCRESIPYWGSVPNTKENQLGYLYTPSSFRAVPVPYRTKRYGML